MQTHSLVAGLAAPLSEMHHNTIKARQRSWRCLSRRLFKALKTPRNVLSPASTPLTGGQAGLIGVKRPGD